MEHTQTRDIPGAQVRAQLRHADVVCHLRDAHLPAVQRGVLIEYIGAAAVHDNREELGGARFLNDAADQMPDLPRLRETTRRLASSFVHPPIR